MLLGLPASLVSVLAFSARTRRKQSIDSETRCRKCNYILRGLTEPRCPECGGEDMRRGIIRLTEVARRVLLGAVAFLSVGLVLLCIRSIWTCDEWNWRRQRGELHGVLVQDRMLAINRMRVMYQMTDEHRNLREPEGPLRWSARPSFELERNVSFWQKYRFRILPGPMNHPPEGTDTLLVFPLWGLALVLGAWPLFSLRRVFRTRQPGLCSNCGYSLTGNTSGVCPECGTAVGSAE
jgi:RNA polymerase subunit RPABC4/transcription elongation factor Spt4